MNPIHLIWLIVVQEMSAFASDDNHSVIVIDYLVGFEVPKSDVVLNQTHILVRACGSYIDPSEWNWLR